MKTVSVRDLQHGLADVLGRVEQGEEIAVTRRSRVVAKIVPPVVAKPDIDFERRLKAIYHKDLPASRSVSKIITTERSQR